MITLLSRKRTSSLALAIALATGAATVATAILPAEASAQRKRDRDRDSDKEEQTGGGYSDEFRAAYVPLDEALKAEGVDVAALRPQLLALIPLLNTDDEKIAGGGLIFNSGIKASDRDLQLEGMQLMLASGKVPVEQIGRYNFIAYQLSNAKQDYATSRRYLQGAIDNNFATDSISVADLRIAMAESFFSNNELQQGYDYLKDAIATRKTQGQSVAEQWYRRGVTVAYENESVPEVYDFVSMWISDYSSQANWRDAVNLTRNLNSFQGPEILDLFRLARRTGALQDASDYDYYVEAADARRLPKEVKDVITEGKAAGILTSNNLFIVESEETATSRLAADRADLPALERDASAAGAGMRTVVAAGDAFLSYEDYAKAANFYERATTMPGVDTNQVLLRLAIAQIELGNYDAARTSLGRVTGTRMPIAKLWEAYANEKQAAMAPAAPAVATM